jgi:hypothetical protein
MKAPDYFTITCILAIVILTGCVLWLPFLWRLLHPAVAKLPDGEINVAPPPIARRTDEKETRKTISLGDGRRAAYDSVYADHDGNAAPYGSTKSEFASEDGAADAPLLPTSTAPDNDCRGRLRRCWGAVRRRCRRGGRVVRREPLYQRYKAFRTAAYGTWAIGARDERAARTMALEFFLHRLVLGMVIGVAAESTKGQLALAWLVSLAFCASSYAMGTTAERVAAMADKVPLVQVPAHNIANTFETAAAWKAHLLGRVSVCILYFVALINVVTDACKEPSSTECEIVSHLGLVVACLSFVLPLALVFHGKCAKKLKRDNLAEQETEDDDDDDDTGQDSGYVEHGGDDSGETSSTATAQSAEQHNDTSTTAAQSTEQHNDTTSVAAAPSATGEGVASASAVAAQEPPSTPTDQAPSAR